VYEDYFSKKVDDGARSGLQDGKTVGLKLAFQRGQVNAFDEKYRARSVRGFYDQFEVSYTEMFKTGFFKTTSAILNWS